MIVLEFKSGCEVDFARCGVTALED